MKLPFARRFRGWLRRFTELQPAYRDTEVEYERGFWLGLLYVGLAGTWAVIATILIYAGLTWPEPNRGWIVLCMAGSISFTVIAYCKRHRIVTGPRRLRVFCGWNIISFAWLALICMLDGGVASPLTDLLLLPMLYLAIGYPVRAVVLCGALEMITVMGLLSYSASSALHSALSLQMLALGISWLLAVIGAVNRERNERKLRGLREQLEAAATIDGLTGCLNQETFTTVMRREVARAARYGSVLALLVIDIDEFKRINDRHGHLMGDKVLSQLGKLLRRTARTADIVGRVGGDELALIAPETGRDAAYALAERLRRRVKTQSLPVNITLSIGICALVPQNEQAATLFRRADQALYTAKNRGRDQVAIHDIDDTAASLGSRLAAY